jgi:predicted transcriptional regulator
LQSAEVTTRRREENRLGGPHGIEPARLRLGYSRAMNANVSIEVDKHTAEVLEARAAELGVTVSQLIAELAALDGAPREADADEVAELDRRSGRAEEGSPGPHDRVVRWLRTWGTSGFRPWPGQ